MGLVGALLQLSTAHNRPQPIATASNRQLTNPTDGQPVVSGWCPPSFKGAEFIACHDLLDFWGFPSSELKSCKPGPKLGTNPIAPQPTLPSHQLTPTNTNGPKWHPIDTQLTNTLELTILGTWGPMPHTLRARRVGVRGVRCPSCTSQGF